MEYFVGISFNSRTVIVRTAFSAVLLALGLTIYQPGYAQEEIPSPSVQATTPAVTTPQPVALEPISPDTILPVFKAKLLPAYFPPSMQKVFSIFQAGDYDAVVSSIEPIEQQETFSKRAPLPDRILVLKALALIGQNKLSEADQTISKGLSLKASNPELVFLRGVIHAAQADFPNATQAFEETVWFGKGTVASPDLAQFGLGLLYARQKLSPKAISAFNAALALNPELTQARLEIASLSLESGDKATAITKLREVLAKDPSSFHARLYLAKALLVNADRLLNRKEISEAKQIMSDTLKPKDLSKDQYLEALPVFVQAQLSSGDIDAAQKVVDAALKRDPQSTPILQLRDQIDLERQAAG